MRYMTATAARTDLLKLLEDLGERVAITKNGQPVAVLLDFDEYRVLRSAQALARDPARLEQVRTTVARVQAGDLERFADAHTVMPAPALPSARAR